MTDREQNEKDAPLNSAVRLLVILRILSQVRFSYACVCG